MLTMNFPSLILIAMIHLALGQYTETPVDTELKHMTSRQGVSISYKQTQICETRARAWAGYVRIPSTLLSNIESNEPYNLSMFFWYFEARNDPRSAPTGMYFAGGPGASSIDDAVTGGGPCVVLPDSNSTAENTWSWNSNMNMLYLDQPVSTGFSYTRKVRSAVDLLFLGSPVTETGINAIDTYNNSLPSENSTFLYGTLSEQDPTKIVNTSLSAAKTVWQFSQVWFRDFPEYKTDNRNVNVWGNSYGGFWVPTIAAHFVRQNELIQKGALSGMIIPINTVGWTNGCVDMLYQGEWYPHQAYNNTYSLQVISEDVYTDAVHNFTKTGGCRDQISQCRQLGDLYDPDYLGIAANVNLACVAALEYCELYVIGAYDTYINRSDFNLAHFKPDPYPPNYSNGYYNQAWVHKELGVPVNFTSSLLANNVFIYSTGDAVRVKGLENAQYLLSHGVKVIMMYGDLVYRCPWIGAEQLSLALEWAGASKFKNAGYEYVQTNDIYRGGVVRQHGNLSFARIFEAGHFAQAYQPETVFRLVNRAIMDTDLANGRVKIHNGLEYISRGPASSFDITTALPLPPSQWNCNLWNIASTCTQEQYDALVNGTALVKDFSIVEPAGGSPGGIQQVF